jgi:hypothetical protein
MVEAAAEQNDELMEKFLVGQSLRGLIDSALRAGTLSCSLTTRSVSTSYRNKVVSHCRTPCGVPALPPDEPPRTA